MSEQPETGSGRGGAMGTPTGAPEEASPETDQEANRVVSGGGVIGPDEEDGEAHDAARRQQRADPSADDPSVEGDPVQADPSVSGDT